MAVTFENLQVKVINGAVAGLIGVAATFPLDLVKTNLQYKPTEFRGIPDCFRKIYAQGGIRSFYRGIRPNLVFISPEKAIKLSCNDIFRQRLKGNRKQLPVYMECMAGGLAGMCQVTVTTPMELLKIAGQTSDGGKSKGALSHALTIIRERGITGIYQGAGSTLLRDIPFSMMYFPLFAHLNHLYLNPDGTANPLWSLASGVGAGAFAAWFFTPMDYVKTQVQAPGAKRQVGEVIRTTYRDLGVLAFYKGAAARAMVVAPLFGVAQMVYYLGVAEYALGRQWDKPTT